VTQEKHTTDTDKIQSETADFLIRPHELPPPSEVDETCVVFDSVPVAPLCENTMSFTKLEVHKKRSNSLSYGYQWRRATPGRARLTRLTYAPAVALAERVSRLRMQGCTEWPLTFHWPAMNDLPVLSLDGLAPPLTATGVQNVYRKFGKIWTCVFLRYTSGQTNKQTNQIDRHADRSPIGGEWATYTKTSYLRPLLSVVFFCLFRFHWFFIVYKWM